MEIQLEEVWKNYRDRSCGVKMPDVLRGISLTIKQGEYLAITGTSGCGKTTFLKIIGLAESPTDGELYLDGVSVSDLLKEEKADIRRRRIGFVFQDYFLLENLTALENMMLPGLLDKKDSVMVRNRSFELAEYLGIAPILLKKYPGELSGGERQRIAIARALQNDPEVLLADEPTGNLDEVSRETIGNIFERLHQDQNKTIILVTHDQKLAETSEKYYRLKDGNLHLRRS
nr:ABC transporter ATP-binding protein [uncultured Merdimonas sp.]